MNPDLRRFADAHPISRDCVATQEARHNTADNGGVGVAIASLLDEFKGVRIAVIDAFGNQRALTDAQLASVEKEFTAATEVGEDIVLSIHVSPWQNNNKRRGKYNQIDECRELLRELMKEHPVALCLSGHYHTAVWGAKEEETQYLVLPGTALAKAGPVGWCVFDVYSDRIVMHQKPLFFAYETEEVTSINGGNGWVSYEDRKARYPYTQ